MATSPESRQPTLTEGQQLETVAALLPTSLEGPVRQPENPDTIGWFDVSAANREHYQGQPARFALLDVPHSVFADGSRIGSNTLLVEAKFEGDEIPKTAILSAGDDFKKIVDSQITPICKIPIGLSPDVTDLRIAFLAEDNVTKYPLREDVVQVSAWAFESPLKEPEYNLIIPVDPPGRS